MTPFADLFAAALPADDVRFDVPLATLGRWRIGGPADVVVTPSTRASLAAALRLIKAHDVPHVIVGDGSNLLFDDAGLRGAVLKIGRRFGGMTTSADGRVEAGAGLWVPAFVRRTIDAGLSGVVHAIGIPGTLGGLCAMNGGSQRKGIGDHLTRLEAMDYDGQVTTFARADLTYSYRYSRLLDGGLVVLKAWFQLEPGDAAALRREAIGILRDRRAKFPKVRANCGSVFVSDPKLYAMIGPPGRAIEEAGLKGFAIGDAQFSPDHANFIVNNGRAGSGQVLALIEKARSRVAEATGVSMRAEVRYVRADGSVCAI
jgi:UDP-N-acetylmuramate dehydrogenase